MGTLALAVFAALAGVNYLVLGPYVLRLDRRSRPHQTFFLLCLSFAVWAWCFTFFVGAPSIPAAWVWYRLAAVGWCLGPALLFHFLAGLSQRLLATRGRWVLVLVYAVGVLFLLRSSTGTVFARTFVSTPCGWDEVVTPLGFWPWAYVLYYSGCAATGLWFVYRWGKTGSPRDRLQARLIIWSGVPTLLVVSVNNVVLGFLDVHVFPGIAIILLSAWSIGIW